MKTRLAMLVALTAAVLTACSACSTMTTDVDWDRAVDFSKYRTFAFQKGAPARNDFSQRRIEAAITAKLQARGLSLAPNHPDLRVVTHVVLSRQQRIDTYGYGYGWRWGGGMATTTVTNVPVGTLLVDLVDTQAKELVWRGRATDTVGSDREEREEKLQEAMDKLFASFPPPPPH